MIGVDSLSLSRKLQTTGFTQDQAEEVAQLVEATAKLCFADLVRGRDLESLRVSLLQDGALASHDLRRVVFSSKESIDSLAGHVGDLRDSYKSQMSALNTILTINVVLMSVILGSVILYFTNRTW